MTVPKLARSPNCPQCGAEWAAGQTCACATASAPIQFGLSSMLLLTTLLAAVCGVFVVAPRVGLLVALLALPGLVRTAILGRRDRVAGRPLGWSDQLLTFLATLAFVFLLLVAMAAVFYVMCWLGFMGATMAYELWTDRYGVGPIGIAYVVGIGFGLVGTTLVMLWLIYHAVKSIYRVPAWTEWAGFLLSFFALAAYWAALTNAAELKGYWLLASTLGLAFSMLGLGAAKRWRNAWGVGLGAGPLGVCLLLTRFGDSGWHALDSIAALIAATVLALAIALPLHFWVMSLAAPQRQISQLMEKNEQPATT